MPKPLERERVQTEVTRLLAAEKAKREAPALVESKPGYQPPFGSNPPEAIVFTSNSYRKAIMLYWQLMAGYDLHQWPEFAKKFPYRPEELTTPLSVHEYFAQYIPNGDGVIREPFIIGYLPDGIPILCCPTDGETASNDDPLGEAQNKIDDARDWFAGHDVVFFSTDAVQHLPTTENKLGKPYKHPLYRSTMERALETGISLDEAEETFPFLYKKHFYVQEGVAAILLQHLTGVVVQRGTKRIGKTVALQFQASRELVLREEVTVIPDMGGGGVLQQLIELASRENLEVLSSLDEKQLADYLKTMERGNWLALVIFQIMGAPGWMLHSLVLELENSKERLQ